LRFARLLKAEDFIVGLNRWLIRFFFLTAEGAEGAEKGEKRESGLPLGGAGFSDGRFEAVIVC